MFQFDNTKFRVESCTIRSLSKATIDPSITYTDSKKNVVKKKVPVSIARIVRNQLHGVTKFIEEYPCMIAFVDDRIVSLSVPIGADYKMWKDTGDWISVLESREEIISKLGTDWHWDGQYAYQFTNEVEQLGDTNFGVAKVKAFNLFKLGESQADIVEHLAAFCFKNPTTGQWVKTTPMTRISGGFIQLSGDVEQFNKTDDFVEKDAAQELKKLDRSKFVNLRFVNYASQVLSNQFGYEAIEPLGIPLLMIEHRTFNLGGLATPVQMSSAAPLTYTQALAWMIGLYSKVKTLDDLIAVKSTLKMLLSKGNTNTWATQDSAGNGVNTKDVIATLRKKLESAPLISFDND